MVNIKQATLKHVPSFRKVQYVTYVPSTCGSIEPVAFSCQLIILHRKFFMPRLMQFMFESWSIGRQPLGSHEFAINRPILSFSYHFNLQIWSTNHKVLWRQSIKMLLQW